MPGPVSDTYDPFPYDPKALELAEHYLQDEPRINDPEHRIALAMHIQRAVEDWFVNE